jgi:murein DD-endopeptidase MepM/ murein hydrolase activator NlpD
MRDYKPTPAKPQPRWHWLLWFVAGLGLPLATVTLLQPDSKTPPELAADEIAPQITAPEQQQRGAEKADKALTATAEDAVLADQPVTVPEPPGTVTMLTVGRGDSLDYLFRRNDLSIGDLTLIMRQDLARKHLRLIKPGDQIKVTHEGKTVLRVEREIDFARSLEVTRLDEGYTAQLIEHVLQAQQVEAAGVIKDSLFLSAADAGISERLIMNLAGIFAWDIDFVLDIRTGDTFSIIVEELWRDGKRVAEGDILAAEFVNQGEQFRAIMYRSPDGTVSYFSPEGKNMRKAFLRAPLSFSRISSNFNPNRRHPVLNTIRAHKGVDYAAPSGTPIKAAGDGKVIFRGVKGGYGNTIILQHGSNITTLYAHMQRFNRAARNGMRVRQGTVIGYVGQSGLATGPHLHYEYRKNGVHMNPRTVKLPDAAPIDPALKADFEKVAAPLLAKLDRSNIGMIAQAKTN